MSLLSLKELVTPWDATIVIERTSDTLRCHYCHYKNWWHLEMSLLSLKELVTPWDVTIVIERTSDTVRCHYCHWKNWWHLEMSLLLLKELVTPWDVTIVSATLNPNFFSQISLQWYTDSEIDGQLKEEISIASPRYSVRSGGILILFNQYLFGM